MQKSFQQLQLEHLKECEKTLSGLESETMYEKILDRATSQFQHQVSKIVSHLNEKFLEFIDDNSPVLKKYHQPTDKLRESLDQEIKYSMSEPMSDLDVAKRVQRLGKFLQNFTLTTDLIKRKSEIAVDVLIDLDKEVLSEYLMRCVQVKVRVMNEELSLHFQEESKTESKEILIKDNLRDLDTKIEGIKKEREEDLTPARQLEKALARELELHKSLEEMNRQNHALRTQLEKVAKCMQAAQNEARLPELAFLPSQQILRLHLTIQQARDRYGFVFRPLNRYFKHDGINWNSKLQYSKDTETRGGEIYALYKYDAVVDSKLLPPEKLQELLTAHKQDWRLHSIDIEVKSEGA